MHREILNDLEKWKDKSRRKPLILTGVRQCGKTYIVNEFARKNFESYVYVNFESDETLAAIFDYDFDVDRIIKELEQHFKIQITPGKTLIFFDEIQECTRAITSLKYFCEKKRELHVVCAGSLLGVALKKKQISFPVGKVNRIQLYPMSFKEFIIANGRADLIDIFKEWPIDREIPKLYTVPMEELLKAYYIVGGMPEVVNTWIETHDYNEVIEVQDEILDDYSYDFSNHAPLTDVTKIRWIWDSVPVQLAKENNKFIFSHVKEGKRSAELEDAIQWLVDAGLLVKAELVEKPELPLEGAADNTQAKSYRQFCKKYQPKKGLKLSRKNIAENLCESTTTYNIPLYLEWNIDSYIKYN